MAATQDIPRKVCYTESLTWIQGAELYEGGDGLNRAGYDNSHVLLYIQRVCLCSKMYSILCHFILAISTLVESI